MATADKIPDDEWRLDGGSDEPEPQPAPPPTVAVTNLSAERLARAVYVVTVEHVAWYVVAAYAIVTRIAALGARPLDPAPARDALSAFYIAAHGRAAFALADASWVTILEGWIFASAGANEANARIVVTLCGLILVAAAFAMSEVLGRAGALAFGAIVAISPSLTYFTRGGSTAIASVTFMIVAIAITESMRRRPTITRAAGLGAAIALWLTADPIGYVTAAAIVGSLLLVGAVDAIRLDHRRLRLRVWWDRRRVQVIVGAVVAIGLWLVLATAFFHRPLVAAVEYYAYAAFATPAIAVHGATRTLVPILVFYEFIAVKLALFGIFAIVTRRAGDRFATWALVWAIVSLAILGSISANRDDAVVAIILPLVIVGAYAVDWMHQSERWGSIRYAIAGVIGLTLFVQLTVNFVYSAPDVSEAPWRRHALLFWADPATSIQTVRECARARSAVPPAGATALVPDDAPQVQWYLRDYTPTASLDGASIVVTVGKTRSGSLAANPDAPQFGFEESWTPNFHALTPVAAISYLLTQRAWSEVEIRDLQIVVAPAKAP
jgi:predicted membrane-bound mannosyltransferase